MLTPYRAVSPEPARPSFCASFWDLRNCSSATLGTSFRCCFSFSLCVFACLLYLCNISSGTRGFLYLFIHIFIFLHSYKNETPSHTKKVLSSHLRGKVALFFQQSSHHFSCRDDKAEGPCCPPCPCMAVVHRRDAHAWAKPLAGGAQGCAGCTQGAAGIQIQPLALLWHRCGDGVGHNNQTQAPLL